MRNSYLLALLLVSSLSFAACEHEENISGDAGQGDLEGDSGNPSEGVDRDASGNSEEEVPAELPLVDPKCSSLRLMEFKSAEIGPEGGLINLAFTEIRIPKGMLKEKIKVSIARYGISEKASKFDYYEIHPVFEVNFDRRFRVSLRTDSPEVYPKDGVFGYIREDDFWWVPTQRISYFGGYIGYFWKFGRIGIREQGRKPSMLCPEKGAAKSAGEIRKGELDGQTYLGKCFDAEYIKTTEGCENFGAICHQGLAGNFLCETCFLRRGKCGQSPRLDCCQTCEIATITNIDFKCTADKEELTKDIECVIEEYFFTGDCFEFNQGISHLGGFFAEMVSSCPEIDTPEIIKTESGEGETCVTVKTSQLKGMPISILRYPKWENMPSGCADAWELFDCELRRHEKKHYDIGLAMCENRKIAFHEITSLKHCSDDPNQAVADALADYNDKIWNAAKIIHDISQEESDDFDRATNHGNVQLKCPC